jgi:uncharacterized protein YyaL (SSP411 family)
MIQTLNSNYLPNVVIELKNPNNTKEKKMLNNKATAYICSNKSCKAPTNNLDKMLELLKSDQ